jgi:hypothetical protein
LEKVEKIPWHWIIPLAVLYVIFVNIGTAFLTAAIGGIYNLQENLYVMEFRAAPLTGLVFLYIFVNIRPSFRK